ncbi:MAG: DUF192 domain-containing protein [Nitrospinae bacterium]|nr:DUF192 domain-containing protein [Nitrospinota bacterium]
MKLNILIINMLTMALLANPSFARSVKFPQSPGLVQVTVEVADTPSKTQMGLMFRGALPEGTGMWFIFPQDEALYFWMKNMAIPLDIIFIDKEFIIRKIWSGVPPCRGEPCPRYGSGTAVRYALEVPAGYCLRHGIMEKTRVEYKK